MKITLKPTCAMIAAGLCLLTQISAARAQRQAHITVNAADSQRVLSANAFGINTAVWDDLLADPAVPGLITQTGATVLRFPGGSTADTYHWNDQKTEDIGQNTAFDVFMGVAKKSNANAIITVNYGSGSPAEAAGWVSHAKKYGYGVKYWEIGNEVYGNGFYGPKWENDDHTIKSPTEYGKNVVEYIRQMKQVDPSIKVGAVLTLPHLDQGGINDPVGYSNDPALDWNTNVLKECGDKIDFIVVHWYPQEAGKNDNVHLLGSASIIKPYMDELRSKIASRPNVEVLVTETNSTSGTPPKESIATPNALFLADDMLTWLEQGAVNVDWWDLHNGPVYDPKSSSNKVEYGNYGLLASGQTVKLGNDDKTRNVEVKDSNGNVVREPGANTPYPTFYAMKMLNNFAHPGDAVFSVTPDVAIPNVTIHAARQANGNLSLLLINKDSVNAQTCSLSLNGFTPRSNATQFYYGTNSTDVAQSARNDVGGNFTVTLPAYSLTVLNLTAAPVSSAPAFTSSATAAPATLAPGQTLTIHAIPVDTGGALTNGVVDVEVFDASYNRVAQQFYTQQNFASGQSRDYAWTLPAPTNMGTYTVKVGVFSQDWSSLIHWNDKATTFTVFLSDLSQYNFETGTQGWTGTGGAIVNVASTTARAFLGAQSLAVSFNSSHSDTQQVYVPLPSVAAGKTVTLHVWIPGGSAVYAVQPYVLQGAAGNWQWTGNFQYTSGMTPNAWNTIQVTVPANAATPLAQLGIQFFTGSGWSGTCYIDSISW